MNSIVINSIWIGGLLTIVQIIFLYRMKIKTKLYMYKFYTFTDFVMAMLSVKAVGSNSVTAIGAVVLNMILITLYIEYQRKIHAEEIAKIRDINLFTWIGDGIEKLLSRREDKN